MAMLAVMKASDSAVTTEALVVKTAKMAETVLATTAESKGRFFPDINILVSVTNSML